MVDSDSLETRLRDLLSGVRDDLTSRLMRLVPLEWLERERREREKREHERREAGRNRTHSARGRLLFAAPAPDGGTKPLHHMEVELWDRDRVGSGDILGRAVTDREGGFEIRYDPRDAGRGDRPDFELRLIEATWRRDPKRALAVPERHVVHKIRGPDDVDVTSYDFGDCRVPYWSYRGSLTAPDFRPERPPRAHVDTDFGEGLPQDLSAARKACAVQVIAEVARVRTRHLRAIARERPPELEAIQRDYPSARTRELDEETLRSDDHLASRVLNGFHPCLLERSEDGGHCVSFSYEGLELDDRHFAADTRAFFHVEEGRLRLDRIAVRKRRLEGGGRVVEPTELCSPADGEVRWNAAKRLFRINLALFGEVETHLGRAHVNVEQYAIAAYRNLRRNPVARLLLPHLKEVVVINHRAESSLLGENGFVVRGSPLTARSCSDLLARSLRWHDWAGFRPREPVCDDHRFAKLGQLYWSAVSEWVDDFFAVHREEIEQHWFEIRAMSDELVAHSVPFEPCGGDVSWADANEINDCHELRQERDGAARAVSAVTLQDEADERGFENLKQLCRYVIHHATFFHTWANDEQANDCGELALASLGVGEDLLAAPERPGITPFEATNQLFFVYYLTRTRHGYVTLNEDRDVEPAFGRLLRGRGAEFAKLGLDVNDIRACVNI